MKKLKVLFIVLVMIIISGCSSNTKEGELDNIKYKETEEVTNNVKITMNDNSMMLIELYPDIAPLTTQNFQKLVKEKFYDGLTFHRVIKDFMIQGGDPNGDGTGGSPDKIKGEFKLNGIENNLKHERGVISMARSNDRDSASSQFFICHKDSFHLDGSYAAFGKMIAGYDTLDKIANKEVDENDKPKTKQVIKSITFVNIQK